MSEAPETPGFHDEIRRLAGEAASESREHEARTRKLALRKPFKLFVWVGVSLIALELVSLIAMYSMQRWQLAPRTPPKLTRSARLDCPRIAYSTYWQVVAFMQDHGHPPVTLSELLGKYTDKLPGDPKTGKPLEYSTDGKQFTVNCPSR